MKKDYIYQILSQFFTNTYPSSTEEKIQKWLINDKWTAEKDKALETIWDNIPMTSDENTNKVLDRVNKAIKVIESRQKYSRRKNFRLSYFAFIVPLALLFAGYYYINFSHQKIEMIEITTSYNEQKECTLPDGSTLLLNSGSKVIYPSKFKDTIRVITLEGEAYFNVTSNAIKPFIVQTSSLLIKVLGTKFNVSAYPTDDIATATLNSGSVQVKVKTQTEDNKYILKPNQQIIYNKVDKSVLINAAVDETVGWKDGYLIFQNATFNDIMNTLQRRFNVLIIYDISTFDNIPYTAKFVHNENIVDVLNILQDVMGNFNYEIEDNRIMLFKK